MENQILATCPAGYSAQGNTYGEWFCNGEWCEPWDPFSNRQNIRHVYIHCVVGIAANSNDRLAIETPALAIPLPFGDVFVYMHVPSPSTVGINPSILTQEIGSR